MKKFGMVFTTLLLSSVIIGCDSADTPTATVNINADINVETEAKKKPIPVNHSGTILGNEQQYDPGTISGTNY
ncbi:MAG: hypothetical protein ABW168_18725 [Sedimenticola sp.]